MPIKTDELRTLALEMMPSPAEVAAEYPITEEIAMHVKHARSVIEGILTGNDPRLLVVIGPCSIHDPVAGLEYAKRLAEFAAAHEETLFIVMRAYFEKPRTVVGWKGMINDPHLDGSCQLREGLFAARKFLVEVNELGLPVATEFLDMVVGQYIADLIAWGAIGARTTESQIHREMASALSCPVGFKNGTEGNIGIALDAIRSSQTSHLFCSPDKNGVMTIYRTAGNPFGHVILRGGLKPNYDREVIENTAQALKDCGLNARLIVDFSHANCQRQFKRQLDVARDVCNQLIEGNEAIAGVMAESFLVEGSQVVNKDELDKLVYGQSITDPCLGWDDTVALLEMLSQTVAQRNQTV
ncbi:MAG: 3-deoxy-7-phosphoheptulonate synthase [Vibrionaceae bacterium]